MNVIISHTNVGPKLNRIVIELKADKIKIKFDCDQSVFNTRSIDRDWLDWRPMVSRPTQRVDRMSTCLGWHSNKNDIIGTKYLKYYMQHFRMVYTRI